MKSLATRLAVLVLAAVVAPAVALAAGPDGADQVVTPERMNDVAAVRDVRVQDGQVAGVVENRSSDTLRNVQLRIHSLWLWNHEFRPGEDDQSRVDYYTVPDEIPPHGSARFTTSVPVASRSDGRYETLVTVADVTELRTPAGGTRSPTGGMP